MIKGQRRQRFFQGPRHRHHVRSAAVPCRGAAIRSRQSAARQARPCRQPHATRLSRRWTRMACNCAAAGPRPRWTMGCRHCTLARVPRWFRWWGRSGPLAGAHFPAPGSTPMACQTRRTAGASPSATRWRTRMAASPSIRPTDRRMRRSSNRRAAPIPICRPARCCGRFIRHRGRGMRCGLRWSCRR